MYWCKVFNQIKKNGSPPERELYPRISILMLIVILISLLSSCKPDAVQSGVSKKYFDLQGYFKADAARLNELHEVTLKTVTHNGISETKKVHIGNWGIELGLFSGSDINKPAWKDSYNVSDNGDIIIYAAKDPELKTREIMISKQNNKIKSIFINNSTQNLLYQTNEKLSYFPDSVYIIEKFQKVKLLGANHYIIRGTLN